MSDNDAILTALGRIEGKLDSEIDMAKEHREDDKRRFSDVYAKIGEHSDQIAEAKGAAGMIRWLVGGGLAALATSVVALAKAFGWHQ